MNRRLDRIDCQLLDILQKEARLSNKELAARVGLAPSTCLERVRRLGQEGFLEGFHAEVNPKALGIQVQALISVRLGQHSRTSFREFRRHLLAQQEVSTVFQVGGKHDFLAHVVVRDTDHLRDFALDQVASRPEVDHIETSLIFDLHRHPALPNYLAEEDSSA
ncbi:MAG: Lrp/AsnC family transcriptional regulator [Planctomycetota bacterium]|nr:MAG: Lrp/AsnC family transcriptional regulator [Planctomycetota bacterium]